MAPGKQRNSSGASRRMSPQHLVRGTVAGVALGCVVMLGTPGHIAPAAADPDDDSSSVEATSTSAAPTPSGTPPDESPDAGPAAVPPTLTLGPGQGRAGTRITATTTGFLMCRRFPNLMTQQWDDRSPTHAGATTTDFDGVVLEAEFTVPEDIAAGQHTVIAQCGVELASAGFTVDQAEAPGLTLGTPEGERGSQVTVSGTGFACEKGIVDLLWDGRVRLSAVAPGAFEEPLTVPSDAPIGLHDVVASCREQPEITDQQPFTVTSSATAPVTTSETATPGVATLTLLPTQGAVREDVRATGGTFGCPSNTVDLFWDDGTYLRSVPVDASGRIDAAIVVPANADGRRHTVSAGCSGEPAAVAASFTVVADVGVEGGDPSNGTSHWWVVMALIAAAMVVLALLIWLRHRPKPKPKPKPKPVNVRAVARISSPPLVTVRETGPPREATYTFHLQTRYDPGTLIIREVDHDRKRP